MANYDLNLRDYWRILRKRKFIVAFTTITLGLFSFLFAILDQPIPLYESTASIKVEQNISPTGLYMQTVPWSHVDYLQTQISVIKSYEVMEESAKTLGLIPYVIPSQEVLAEKRYQSIIVNLRNSLRVEQEGFSNIINITVTSESPDFSHRAANTIAREYKEHHFLEINKRTVDARKFIEKQVETVKERLRKAEDDVKKYREKNNLISLNSQTSSMLSQLTVLQAQHEKALADYQKINDVEKQLENASDKPLTSESSYYINEASSLYKNLNDRLVQLMLSRDSLLIVYTDKYPQVVEINKQIQEIVTNMKAQLSSQKKILGESIRTLKKKIDEVDLQIQILPEKGLALARLEQEVGVNNEIYKLLEKKYQEALIKEAEMVEEVQLVKPALESSSPINPPQKTAAGFIGTLIGLILGVVFAFIVETFDTSMAAIEEIEELTGINVLGIIPHATVSEIKKTLLKESTEDIDDETAEKYSRIISHFAPNSTLAESYRSLRTNLSFAGLEGDMKTIVFTSSSPREGKTTVVINLAVAVAQSDRKILLIDGDMRKPMIASIFGIKQAPGLSDVILGNSSLEEATKSVTDIMMGKMSMEDIMKTPGMDNLHILTSGTIPPNPSELVSFKRTAELIEEAKSRYDLVLIDAPPLLAATEAAIYGTIADGVVIVYRVGKIGRAVLKRAKAQLDNVRAKAIGIVLNGLKADISPDFTRQDYYKYYSYYSGKPDKKEKSKQKKR